MINADTKVIYGYDTLCGWCYGLVPALRHFVKRHPDIPVRVVPGGLFTGPNARPYSSLVGHIQKHEVNLEQITGYKPSDAFHSMIAKGTGVVAESAVPSHAILQMDRLAPDRVLEFAHLLQEAHFRDGKDLNHAETYDEICEKNDLPMLDTRAILKATTSDPLVAKSFLAAAELGIRSYPTVLLTDAEDRILATISSTYAPGKFVAEIEKRL